MNARVPLTRDNVLLANMSLNFVMTRLAPSLIFWLFLVPPPQASAQTTNATCLAGFNWVGDRMKTYGLQHVDTQWHLSHIRVLTLDRKALASWQHI